MDFQKFTEEIIDNFFENNDFEKPEFFKDLEEKLKVSQVTLNTELEKMMIQNEAHSKEVEETKDSYISKLDEITNQYNNYELKVESLNKHYSDKLSYISILSKNLSEFEIFSQNVDFAQKIFYYINTLNNPDLGKSMPDIFTNPEKIIEEGVEVFEALRQIVDSASKEYVHVNSNFILIQKKILETVKESIKDCYENNDLAKLERIMKVTEVINSEFIVDMYVDYIVESMNLVDMIKIVEGIDFKGISDTLVRSLFADIEDFHSKIVKTCNLQFGKHASKIYLIFPESKHKIVISNLLTRCSYHLGQFRSLLITENDKSNDMMVKLLEFLYSKSTQFLYAIKDILAFSKTDLWNHLEQENVIFLRRVEGIYMDKEKKLIDSFLKTHYKDQLKAGIENQKNYLDKRNRSKSNELMDILEKNVFDSIEATSFSQISIFSTDVINRSNLLLSNKEEAQDQIETFCKQLLDFFRDLLAGYSNLLKFIILEKEKLNLQVAEPHYFMFARLSFLNEQFKNVFLFDLKDLLRKHKIYDDVEDLVRKRSNDIINTLDNLFSQISSYISSFINQILKIIKVKDIYNLTPTKKDLYYTMEFDSIQHSLKPLFSNIMENWPEGYKKKIFNLITKILIDKFIDIMKNSKLTELGVKTMKNDFLKIQNIYIDFTIDRIFENQINETIFLLEIFVAPRETVDEFVELHSNRYDHELLKLLSKKRKNFKN